MAKLPCPKCGDKDVIGTFCESCLRELHPLITKFKEVKVVFCASSSDVKIGPTWEKRTPDEAVLRVATKALVAANDAVIEEITLGNFEVPEFLGKPGLSRTVEIPVVIHGKASQDLPRSYDEEYVIPITVETTISPRYAKAGSQYFEVTVQVRNEDEERKVLFRKLVAKYPGLAVNKEVRITGGKGGTDYYMTDKRAAFMIVQDLHARFGGVMKRTARLFSKDKQTSKDIYRETLFIEYPAFVPGDALTDGTNTFLVVQLGKKMKIENLTTKKRRMEEYNPDKYKPIEIRTTTLSQVQPKVAVIDPDTFQQVFPKNNQLPEYAAGDEVRVVKLEDKLWILP